MLVEDCLETEQLFANFFSLFINVWYFELLMSFYFAFNVRKTHTSLPNLDFVTWKLVNLWVDVTAISLDIAIRFINPFVIFEVFLNNKKTFSWISLIRCQVGKPERGCCFFHFIEVGERAFVKWELGVLAWSS